MKKITGDEPINFQLDQGNQGEKMEGLTIRQYYAGLAMQGIMSRMGDWNSVSSFDFIGKQALLAADSLIKELNNQP